MADGDDVKRVLGERVKELIALHRAARLLLDDTLGQAARLQAIADLLPAASQYPETATACVRHGDDEYATPGHASTPWVLSSAFQTSDGRRGELEVAYHEERPMAAHGPFLAEEAALVASLADILCSSLDREITATAMREANERLNLALDTAGMGFWEWDLRNNSVRWSRQLAAMAGLGDEKVGKFLQFSSLVHEEDRLILQRRLDRARTEDFAHQGTEFRLRRPDGGWRPMIAYTHRVRDADGKPVRLIASVIDVTERRALEESLRHAQKLEALGQVASGVAHDFNNLLTVFVTGTQMLEAELPADHPARPLVDDMVTAAETGESLTRQLLAFSRRATYEPRAVDVAALARRIESMLARLAGKRVTFSLAAPGELLAVWADPAQLEQVLMNLVLNARDAIGAQRGAIAVTIADASDELVERAKVAPGAYVCVSVTDNGAGIAADIMPRLFEPFFTTKEAGTGLGLAVVANVARQWSGGVVVDSAPGEGATFHVLFPKLAA